MTEQAVLLFGSHARGDVTPESDIDILLITDEEKTRHTSMGTISFYLYPWHELLSLSKDGDLFACHIAMEARVLSDPQNFLQKLKANFKFKSNYASEISRASDVAWFLREHFESLPEYLVNKRAAWSVRTILIAHSAQSQTPIFSPKKLIEASNSAATSNLIKWRSAETLSIEFRDNIKAFLTDFGETAPLQSGSLHDYQLYFKKSRNKVGLQTINLGADIMDYAPT